MRIVNRNCFRRTKILLICCVCFATFLVFIETRFGPGSDASEPQTFHNNEDPNKDNAKNANWEWTHENLQNFMQLLNKREKTFDVNISDTKSISETVSVINNNKSTDNKIKFPHLSKYLPFIGNEDEALIPAHVLSQRPANRKGKLRSNILINSIIISLFCFNFLIRI